MCDCYPTEDAHSRTYTIFITPMLYIKKLRIGDIRELAHHHKAKKGQSWDLNTHKPVCLATLLSDGLPGRRGCAGSGGVQREDVSAGPMQGWRMATTAELRSPTVWL